MSFMKKLLNSKEDDKPFFFRCNYLTRNRMAFPGENLSYSFNWYFYQIYVSMQLYDPRLQNIK